MIEDHLTKSAEYALSAIESIKRGKLKGAIISLECAIREKKENGKVI